MKKTRILIAVGLFLFSVLSFTQGEGLKERLVKYFDPITHQEVDIVADEILVKFKPGTLIDKILQFFRQYSLLKIDAVDEVGWFLLRVPAGKTVTEMIDLLNKDLNILYVEPNFVMKTMATIPDDEHYNKQWGPGMIELDKAWDLEKGSPDITVAVLDTGIDLNHPDLKDNLIRGFDFVTPDFDPADDNGHGTMVAGIIGARGNNNLGIAGVTWYSKLLPVKVIDAEGYGSYWKVGAGIIYSVIKGAKIINVSLGGYSYSRFLEAVVNFALWRDCTLVAAAGNDNTNTPVYPAACEGVIGVAASDKEDKIFSESNWGDFVDLSAPGVDIYSTTLAQSYDYGSGSSFAAASVSGQVALLLSAKSSLTREEIEQILYNNADYITKESGYGHGRINVYRTLLAAKGIENVDISVRDVEIIPETPVSGQEATVKVTLQNQGNVQTSPTILRLHIDDAPFDTVDIPALSPNEVLIKELKWVP